MRDASGRDTAALDAHRGLLDLDVRSITDALARPRPINEVEEIERLAKASWAAAIRGREVTPELSRRFTAFFREIGYLRKYKPYGTKFAAPFGYSIFDLAPQKGFSVQLHRQAKVEAFHILQPHPGAFVFLASRDEWETQATAFLELWRHGRPDDSPLAFRPQAGDLFVVDDLQIVHTIVGCLLEEFATTSNDAVERLYDQNALTVTTLPAAHADLSAVLAAATATPMRVVSRQLRAGWSTAPFSESASAPIIDELAQGLRGWHAEVSSCDGVQIHAPDDRITTIACLAGDAVVRFSDISMSLGVGDTMPLAPGVSGSLSTSTHARVALSQVAVDLAFADLRTL